MLLSELIDMLSDIQNQLEGSDLPDPTVIVHYQGSYPLVGALQNVRVLHTDKWEGGQRVAELALAVGSAPWNRNPYGDRAAWDQTDDVSDSSDDEE